MYRNIYFINYNFKWYKTMKKHNQPILNQLHNTVNWLHNFAPNTFVGLIVFIIFCTIITTFADTNTTSTIVRPIEEVRKLKQTCPCEYEPIGVICSNGALKLNLEPQQGCLCGNYYLTYWICKLKTKEI